ncbi:UDP:flavonoid glycosyltransferase YjiC (YdhE family) [Paraburkholderia sp. BL23I1N1]|uniref:glycosyltransferase n=1 Tax=Paraburkholderia sp. BL23I1N1 TaxID=1938802 RepID=UPI000E75142D|nr:glycosyltransferase [Paraburkholderia sp. BL23I1N1]RKE26235.1 UDP:flavonoid glycosyltransferase YjiC (YdhE family) [Paraburkholderia sp. BL23I1N1]
MKLLAVTYGTEGDTRPLAVLCRALMDAGHEVTLLADQTTLGSARALSVPHAALSGNIRDELGALVSSGKGVNATAAGLAQIANARTHSWMQQIAQAAIGCDGLIVSGLAAFVGLSVGEHLGIRVIGAGLIPISPTHAFASPFLPARWIPGVLNRISHQAVNWLLWHAFRNATNQARQSVLKLPPRQKVWTSHPMLYGVSPALVPEPRDWPAHTRLCGQWLTPEDSWAPPASLKAFLDAGKPPIYLGFGSMVGFDQNAMLDVFMDAAEGRRVLLYPGWSGTPEKALPDNFFLIEETPHQWLFPRTSLVIHHGGSGTTHSACRAGVPSVVLPFAGDQFFWAHQLNRLGVADHAVSTRKLNVDKLKQAIRFAQRAETRQRASTLGNQMAQKTGTATAVVEIETILSR